MNGFILSRRKMRVTTKGRRLKAEDGSIIPFLLQSSLLQNPSMPLPGYLRKPVSSECKGLWTPVFTGVTNSGTFERGSVFSHYFLK
jgi:hypothetical protein